MKVRIGLGLGTRTTVDGPTFATIIDHLEEHQADSIWLSERIAGPAPDPLIALAIAAGRTERLKLGTSVLVLPGRNPVIVAKALATLSVLSGGRLLPAVGLGAVDPTEQRAFGVDRTARGKIFNEMLQVMRQAWSGKPIDFHGEHFDVDDVAVKPVPPRLDVWLGGVAPVELRRVGRLGDGWLPSFITPADAQEGRSVIEAEAAAHGRSIDDDHFGVLIPYRHGTAQVPSQIIDMLRRRRPDLADPTVLVPHIDRDLPDLIESFIAVGTTKFVLLPIAEPSGSSDWSTHLDHVARNILTLEREIS